ncbi:SDR family NAD(P)-dependent oxidoreductase [Neobacillus rhizophilus]|uniref:SDR family NAD(P)-dependent oxidoreductase n=1 Tax=Neobacillus rhizophilus TaxID=2833579 RepID=A0A942U478_9BACI|nr:SDR family NAD(P)-dependent oxidoreductase [Neobacillus rhizophilus]MBS4214375.1 SDR family NAD(P)-dependent oxidoreductase [Neobacillus rhizophilus]
MANNTTIKDWNLQDKYVLITGATSGIGLAAAQAMAARGANLGIIARNHRKAEEISTLLKSQTSKPINVDVFIADLSSQKSIRLVAAEILERCPRIDILVNNAGALFDTFQKTEEGVEMTWAVNHLAPFLLTSLLLERLKESESARVINTASHGHKMAKDGFDFTNVNGEGLYRGFKKIMGGPTIRYAQTKLANILFTSELSRRLEGTNVSIHCFDPGLVATNFNQNNGMMAKATMAVMNLFSRTPEKGADTLVWLAETKDVSNLNGKYCVDRQQKEPAEVAADKELARKLWEISEEQVKLSMNG